MSVTPMTPPPQNTGTDGQTLNGYEWQTRLLELIGRLDHVRSEMERRRLVTDAARLLDLADILLTYCEETLQEISIHPASVPLQMEAFARAGAYFTAAARLRSTLNRGALSSFWSSLTGNEVKLSEDEIRDTLLLVVQAVHQYFVLFTEQFDRSPAVSGWVDAAAAFGSDLRQLLRELPAT